MVATPQLLGPPTKADVSRSLLYYPLAALLGIDLLAVSTVAAAALAFSVVVWRQWGSAARWSSRVFAVTWAGRC